MPFQYHLRRLTSPPPLYKVNLKVYKVVLLCAQTSCGQCVLNQRKIKDTLKHHTTLLATSL